MNSLKQHTKILLCSVGFLLTALLSGCGGGDQGRGPVLGLPAADLVSIAVTPAIASVPTGGTQQFVATATYADGASRDVTASSSWSSGTVAVATVNSATGIATGVASGKAIITASFGSKNGVSDLTVTPAILVRMVVTPANPAIATGATQQFVATGTYTDGSSRDISAISSFTSASPAIATVVASGLATGVSTGTSVISATSGSISAATNLTVTPITLSSIAIAPVNPTMPVGATQQLTIIGTYSNGSTANLTNTTTFTFATTTVAQVGATTGLVTGVAAGSSVVTGSVGGKTATTTITVTPAVLSSIVVTPATASIATGSTQNYVATGTYSDGSSANITTTVSWTSGTTIVATILPTGIATGVAPGTATITATSAGKTANAALTVTTIVVPPVPTAGLNLGTAANFAVLAATSITNNSGGTTFVTGDVGSPSQTVDPVQAAGFTNYKSGPQLTNGLSDMQTAITEGNALACTVSSAAGIDLGGLTFTPGVYCYAGSISITGTFSLNGPGVYVFRTTSTLNSTANSIVALNGGASADTVFWLPVGPTTLGANSVFKGTMLAQSAAITLGDNANLQNGRVLSGAAVTLRNNVITR